MAEDEREDLAGISKRMAALVDRLERSKPSDIVRTTTDADKPTVHEAVNEVRSKVEPVARTQQSGDGYSYRGHAIVRDALAPLMVEAGVHVVPVGVRDILAEWTQNRSGGTERVVGATYVFAVVGPAGDQYTTEVYAEGMNKRDKGAGSAATYAHRRALEFVFNLPTSSPDIEEDNEPAEPRPSSARRQTSGGQPARQSSGPVDKQVGDIVKAINAIEDVDERKRVKEGFLATFGIDEPGKLTKAQLDPAWRWVARHVPEPFEVGSPQGGDESGEDHPEEGPVPLSDAEQAKLDEMRHTKPAKKATKKAKAKKTSKKTTKKAARKAQSAPEADGEGPGSNGADEDGDAQNGSTAVSGADEGAAAARTEMHRVLGLMDRHGAEDAELALTGADLWPINKIPDDRAEEAVGIFAPIAEAAAARKQAADEGAE